jgi:hypothetical protein
MNFAIFRKAIIPMTCKSFNSQMPKEGSTSPLVPEVSPTSIGKAHDLLLSMSGRGKPTSSINL